jgi:hypothetical protein
VTRTAAAIGMAFVLAAPAASWAGGSGFTGRIGAFMPLGHSNLFDDANDLYTLDIGASDPARLKMGDWAGGYGGGEFSFRVARNVELGFHVDGYDRVLDTSYRNHVRKEDGSDIEQTLNLTLVPIGMSIRFVPTSARARIAPYVAFGPDVIYYRYTEEGDFIDFFATPTPQDFPDRFYSDGWTVGAHVAGGVRVAVSDYVWLVGEGRYQWAHLTKMGGDFSDYQIDGSGVAVTVGVYFRY